MVLTPEKQFKVWVKPLVFVAALIPVAFMTIGLLMDTLGANPIEAITRDTGEWALRFLLLTLTITPLRKITGQPAWIRLRRMLGLFVFFYACLHLTTYIWLDQFFDWAEIWNDIVKRPFITVGMLTFLMLIPLAATSTKSMMRRLKKRWVLLHKLVYFAAPAAVLHFWWMKDSKADISEPLIYTTILVFLLGYRVIAWMQKQEYSIGMKTSRTSQKLS